MKYKIISVFFDENGNPFKDVAREVPCSIINGAFIGASNTTKLYFYYDKLLNEDDDPVTCVAVSKLPNGKIGSKVLESYLDEEINEHYALLELDSFYTQYKGDVYLALQGYQGGVQVLEDSETGIYTIVGTPTIQTTGNVRLNILYTPQFIGSDETENVNFQQILADLSTKLGIRTQTILVNELPTIGEDNVFYVIENDSENPDKANIYIWNGKTQSYVWVGDNTLFLGDYYTTEQATTFENGIKARVTAVENELSSVASGSPAGVYTDLDALESADPDHNRIYVVQETGGWYYWDGTQWENGGTYLSTVNAVPETRTIAGIDLVDDITKNELNKEISIACFDPNSKFPIQSETITNHIGYTEETIKTNDLAETNAPPTSGWGNEAMAYGLTFNKSLLLDKGIVSVKTKLCATRTITYPRRIRLSFFETPQTTATEFVSYSGTTLTEIKHYDFDMTENNMVVDVPVDLGYYDIVGNVFLVLFQDLEAQTNGNSIGLYLAKSDAPQSGTQFWGSAYKNAYGIIGFSGAVLLGQYSSAYDNRYIELKTIKAKKIAVEEDVIEKEDMDYEIVQNKNLWNITEQKAQSWANTSNGTIENYPDNQYIEYYLRSGYIEVEYNTQYILSCTQGTQPFGLTYVCCYNASKQFISSFTPTRVDGINGTIINVPNNSNIKYIIIDTVYGATGYSNFQLEKGDTITTYEEFNGTKKKKLNNLLISASQVVGDSGLNYRLLNVPNQVVAVVDDTFELFYQSIMNVNNYKNYYIYCVCDIGQSFERKYKVTPIASNVGEHFINIYVYDNQKNLVDNENIKLKVVAKKTSPLSNKNILCIGDSLTNGGQWVNELNRRLTLTTSVDASGNQTPQGLGLSNITFVGKKHTANNAGFEGYGGFSYGTYLSTTNPAMYWVSTTHDKTDADQESIWKDANNVEWQLETIETNRLKFKKYSGNGVMPSSGTLTWVSGGTHTSNIVFTSSSVSDGNPFVYNGEINFSAYCDDLGISTIDEVYILLGWNSFTTFYSSQDTFKTQVKTFIELLKDFNENILIHLIGLEIPASNGFGQNYGAKSSDNYYKWQQYVFDLNLMYDTISNEYSTGVNYVNLSSQFDSEYNMLTMQTKPNTRNPIQITEQSNAVHPSDYGYYQIADVVYRDFSNH